MITLIITLVVTALITYIITSMYYKHLINHVRKSDIGQQGDPHEGIKKCNPAYAIDAMNNITMDTNPAYGTATRYHKNGY